MSHNPTPRQARAIEALLTAPTIDQAAESAGVARRTIYRWLDDAGFRAALSAAEGKNLDRVTRRLLLLADKALNALESVLDDPRQAGAGNKRLAAQAVLDQVVKLRELRNVEQRLASLEEVVYGNQKKN